MKLSFADWTAKGPESVGEVGNKAGPRKTIGCSAGLGGDDLRPGAGREGAEKRQMNAMFLGHAWLRAGCWPAKGPFFHSQAKEK